MAISDTHIYTDSTGKCHADADTHADKRDAVIPNPVCYTVGYTNRYSQSGPQHERTAYRLGNGQRYL